jgi:hypothetical protein
MTDGSRPERAAALRRVLADLTGSTLAGIDDEVGGVEDVYFDDDSWTVRYLVVGTGTWLSGRQVLVSPAAIEAFEPEARRLTTRLRRSDIEAGPDVSSELPVSRQHELMLALHYRYPSYWAGPLRWGAWADPYGSLGVPPGPGLPPSGRSSAVEEEIAARAWESGDPHLRSAREVKGYAIQATDGALGEVEDLLGEDRAWALRYLVVDTRPWWPSTPVLLPVDWVRALEWGDQKVYVDVTREAVRSAPPYDPSRPVHREWEQGLHRHYGRRGYWEDPPEAWRRRPPAA